jgi:hypothetical protein
MTRTQIRFSHKQKAGIVNRFYFIVTTNKKEVGFYTYTDMSGYEIEDGIELPEEFIFIGTAILTNKQFIKTEIQKHK